ncbi:MAG: hypothetical protein LBH53_02330 [Puniceicoccales bacterium]|jgi:hypothetical protein|nr:hypothetical protein [Puniceicoccales bacterium]
MGRAVANFIAFSERLSYNVCVDAVKTGGKAKRTAKLRKSPALEEFNQSELCRSVQEMRQLLREAGRCELLDEKPSSAITTSVGLRIVARVDVGFNNWLTIRGRGAGLSWDWGVPLKNEGPDRWVWEGVGPLEYKLLLNDALWELGENRVYAGFGDLAVEAVPRFW